MVGELGEALGGVGVCGGLFGGIEGGHYEYVQELKELEKGEEGK